MKVSLLNEKILFQKSVVVSDALGNRKNAWENELISVIRILDSRRENFKLSKAYESKVDVINVITAPEIEMLIIFNEDKYNEFKKSGKKPSIFCKENLRMSSVKSYDFVKGYFENPEILVQAIKKYNEISKIRKGEYTLLDLLK